MSPFAGLRQFVASHTDMSSARNPQPQGFPAVPSSLNAGDHEMRNWEPKNAAPPNTDPQYTPYLGLRARLSQVWINRWTILLVLIICRLLLATKYIDHQLANAKTEALAVCKSVENSGSAMASMPHYLSRGVNSLAGAGITKAVNGLMSMLILSITAIEEIILFVIHMMTSTYLCLITLVITGSLKVAIAMIEGAAKIVNETVGAIAGELEDGIKVFETGLNGFLQGVGKIGGLLTGGSTDPPKLDLSDGINKLQHISIDPSKLDGDLQKLNSSIPTFGDVQNLTDSVIKIPFEMVKTLMREHLGNYKFDDSVFPIPQKEALTFCTDDPAINNFFDGLIKTVLTAKKVILIILILAAILVCVPMAYREIGRWRMMQKRSNMLHENAWDRMDVIYIASRPYTSTTGIKVASRIQSSKGQILARWAVAYATSLPALFVLALGIAGLFTCLCQYIILKIIQKEVPALANEVGDFAGMVVTKLNNASMAWANGANAVINSTNADINKEVFGWVTTSTEAVNDTLNTFTSEMTGALNATFGGTVLYGPISELYNCLIGLKVASFEKGLTWVHDNAHVDFPLFQPDVFSLGAAASIASDSEKTDSFLSNPGDVASDGITNTVIKVVNNLEEQLRQEAIISSCLVALWVFMVLIGLIRVAFAMLSRDKTRAEGGPVGYTGDNRTPISPRSPNRNDDDRFPQFGAPVSSVYPNHSSEDMAWGAGGLHDEKLQDGGHRSVEASYQRGHERVSSYGYVVDSKR